MQFQTEEWKERKDSHRIKSWSFIAQVSGVEGENKNNLGKKNLLGNERFAVLNEEA